MRRGLICFEKAKLFVIYIHETWKVNLSVILHHPQRCIICSKDSVDSTCKLSHGGGSMLRKKTNVHFSMSMYIHKSKGKMPGFAERLAKGVVNSFATLAHFGQNILFATRSAA